MKSHRLHLNLLRDSERLSSSPIRLRVMLPVMAILACIGVAVWWATLAAQLIVVKAQKTSLQEELAGKEADHRSILTHMNELRERQAQLDQLEMYTAGRNTYGELLANLAEVMPLRVQLTKIDIPQQPSQNLLPPGGKGPPAWGPTGTVERMSMRLTGRTTKETPVMALMESLEAPAFTNTLMIVKDARSAEQSPKVHSFRQDGTALADGTRLLAFDIEYRCHPRVFEKPVASAASAQAKEGGAKK